MKEVNISRNLWIIFLIILISFMSIAVFGQANIDHYGKIRMLYGSPRDTMTFSFSGDTNKIVSTNNIYKLDGRLFSESIRINGLEIDSIYNVGDTLYFKTDSGTFKTFMINPSFTESDPVYVGDSAGIIKWTDTIPTNGIATQNDLKNIESSGIDLSSATDMSLLFVKDDTMGWDSKIRWNNQLLIDRGYGIDFTGQGGGNNWRIFQQDANKFYWQYNNVTKFQFIGSDVDCYITGKSNAAGYFALLDKQTSATVPLYTFVGSLTTGLGSSGTNQLSLIANGSERVRIGNDSTWFKHLTGNPGKVLTLSSTGGIYASTPSGFIPDTITITSTNINEGDSILLSSDCDDIVYINFKIGAGTAFTGTGTDSTIVYTRYQGVDYKFLYIPDEWIESSTAIEQKQFFDCPHDTGAPLWINFAPQYTTGTRTLTAILKEE